MVGIVTAAMRPKAPAPPKDPRNPTGGDTYTDANGVQRFGKDPNAAAPVDPGANTASGAPSAPTAPAPPTGDPASSQPQTSGLRPDPRAPGAAPVMRGDPATSQPQIATESGDMGRQVAAVGKVVNRGDPASSQAQLNGTLPPSDKVLGPGAPSPRMSNDEPQVAPETGDLGREPNNQQLTPTSSSPSSPGLPSSSTPAAAVTRTVGENETVQGQIQQLMREGNPLLEAARERAKAYASGRGMVNSAMGAQAGEEAVLSAAMPIATADAGTQSRQALTNQDAENQFLSQGRAIDAQTAAAEKERGWQTGENALNRTSTEGLTREEIAARERLQSEDIRSREGMQDKDLGSRADLTTAELESRERMNSSGLSVQQQIAAGNNAAQLAAAERSAAAQLQLGNMQLEQSRAQLSAQERMQNNELTNRLQVAGFNRETQVQLSAFDANTRLMLQNGQISASMVQSYGNQLSTIMSDPNMSTEDKNAAARNLLALYQGTGHLPITVRWGSGSTGGSKPGGPINPPPGNDSPGG